MKTMVELERFGENYYELERQFNNIPQIGKRENPYPWIAKVLGYCDIYKYKLQFMDYIRDHSEANAAGSRGVKQVYILENGLYRVCEKTSWTKNDKYFLYIEDGVKMRVSETHAKQYIEENILGN